MDLLCAMMDPRNGEELLWTPEDLGGIVRHLLKTPVELELGNPCPSQPHEADLPPDITFEDLLTDPAIPIQILKEAKSYAKKAMGDSQILPKEVAKLLYTAVIARAAASGLKDFSQLGKTGFVRSARWCLAQGWAPESIREVLRAGLSATCDPL